MAGLDAGNCHIQAESKLFVREPEIVRALAEMSHDGAAVAAVPRGPPALAQGAWSAAADSANALAASGEVAIRRRAQEELQTRTFASAVDPINYDQSNEVDTRATSRTHFGTRQGMTARSPGPQPSSRRSSLQS